MSTSTYHVTVGPERLLSLRERLVTTIGIHTVRVLLARAIWTTAQRHPDLALAQLDDADLTLDAVAQSYATQPQEEIEAAFNDLCAEMLLLLARLLGREMAQRLAEELAVNDLAKDRLSNKLPIWGRCSEARHSA
jgi:hypothetical protein